MKHYIVNSSMIIFGAIWFIAAAASPLNQFLNNREPATTAAAIASTALRTSCIFLVKNLWVLFLHNLRHIDVLLWFLRLLLHVWVLKRINWAVKICLCVHRLIKVANFITRVASASLSRNVLLNIRSSKRWSHHHLLSVVLALVLLLILMSRCIY